MSLRRRNWRFRAVLIVLGLIVGLGIIEVCAWGLLRLNPPAAPVGRWEFREARPAPYKNAEYFGPDFLDESMRCLRLGNPSGANYLIPGDFLGRFINVRNGQRQTTDQPEAFEHRLLLFGGSTVFCSTVPDADTLASCLQRALNATPGPRYRVENYGTPAMIARQQTERLAATPLQPGDVVVFYDGFNDVYYPIYNGNPRGFHPGDSDDGGVRKLGGVQAWLYPRCMRLKARSYAAEFLFHNLDNPRPANVVNSRKLNRNLAEAEAGYREALVGACADAKARGAKFVHALQPHLFSVHSPDAYERTVIRNELKWLPGLDRACRLGYPQLHQAATSAAPTGFQHLDLSAILDARTDGEEYYLDYCHTNHSANERVARALCAALRAPAGVK